jgi:hypothetical protein
MEGPFSREYIIAFNPLALDFSLKYMYFTLCLFLGMTNTPSWMANVVSRKRLRPFVARQFSLCSKHVFLGKASGKMYFQMPFFVLLCGYF